MCIVLYPRNKFTDKANNFERLFHLSSVLGAILVGSAGTSTIKGVGGTDFQNKFNRTEQAVECDHS